MTHITALNLENIKLNFTFHSYPFHVTITCSVQESDGSFFESFTALSWKRENRRMSAVRAAETRAEQMPIDEKETIKEDEIETVNEREQLYVDVLYTIANCVGCQQPGGQVCTVFVDIFLYHLLISFLFHSMLTTRMKCI